MQKELVLEHDIAGVAYLRQYKIGKYQVKEYTDSVTGKVTASFVGPLLIDYYDDKFFVKFLCDIDGEDIDGAILKLQDAKEVIRVYKEG